MRGLGANVGTRYAVRALIYLAQQERLRVVPVPEIAQAIGIAPKFLEDILGALRSAGILESRRGKAGGYLLGPTPAELSVLQVVEAMEGPVPESMPEAEDAIARVTAQAFDRALGAAAAVLSELTIERLVEEMRHLEGEPPAAVMYYL